MNTSQPASYSIGALAKASGVAIDTIRYYEKEGLLVEARRSSAGYRQFDDQALRRLQFVRQAKRLGFSLDEVKALLALSVDRESGVQGVQQRARQRLAEIDRRIQELGAMRDALAGLVEACPGQGEPEACPILMSLQGGGVAAEAGCGH
ncbi:heavy metal-responsive transcriptional regulator [Frateuria aurantia]